MGRRPDALAATRRGRLPTRRLWGRRGMRGTKKAPPKRGFLKACAVRQTAAGVFLSVLVPASHSFGFGTSPL